MNHGHSPITPAVGATSPNLSHPLARFTVGRDSRNQKGGLLCASNDSSWVASNQYDEGVR